MLSFVLMLMALQPEERAASENISTLHYIIKFTFLQIQTFDFPDFVW